MKISNKNILALVSSLMAVPNAFAVYCVGTFFRPPNYYKWVAQGAMSYNDTTCECTISTNAINETIGVVKLLERGYEEDYNIVTLSPPKSGWIVSQCSLSAYAIPR